MHQALAFLYQAIRRAKAPVGNALFNQEFARFLLSGGVAAAVNWLSRIFYSQWMDYSWAIVFAYGTGMLVAYLLFRIFVFSAAANSHSSALLPFVLVNILGFSLTWVLSMALGLYIFPALQIHFYPLEVAHGIGVLAPAITSYLGHKHFTFR